MYIYIRDVYYIFKYTYYNNKILHRIEFILIYNNNNNNDGDDFSSFNRRRRWTRTCTYLT